MAVETILSWWSAQRVMCMALKQKQLGVTLVELIIALVIIGVALAAMVTAVGSMAGRSADPAVRQQAIAIANMYMAEVTAKEFTATSPPCLPKPATRAEYTAVCHYNGLTNAAGVNAGARDQLGNSIAGLNQYRIVVNVVDAPNELGLLNNEIPTGDVLRITVTVTGPANTSFALVSYRAKYG